MPNRVPYAVSGLLAAAAGAGVGHLVAAIVAPSASPVLAMGSAVIDATPTPVKEWAVATFGTADKAVLTGSVLVVTGLAAAAIGVLARRRLTLALLLLVGLAAIPTALAASGGTATSALPGLVTGLVGVFVLRSLVAALSGPADPIGLNEPLTRPTASEPTPEGQATPDRRRFLVGATGAGALAAASAGLGQALTATPTPAATELALPTPATTLPKLPTGLESTVRGISPLVTPIKDFYRIDTALVLPRVDIAEWSLTIDGAVDTPVRLSLDDLLAMPLVEADVTLTCVSNEIGGPLIGNARWLGVRVRDLLAGAGIQGGADQVLSTSTDGMTISTPVTALTDSRDALIAVAMDGAPLTREHGYPARLVTPGLYGFVGATKWLTRMTLTTYAADPAYWTTRGWATDSPILTSSRIDVPGSGADLAAGTVAIGGVAWAQHRGISRVEVRVDDGPWAEATLGPDAGIDAWRQWWHPWEATAGKHLLSVRATDGVGDTQPETITEPFPKGATGWHTVAVTVR